MTIKSTVQVTIEKYKPGGPALVAFIGHVVDINR